VDASYVNPFLIAAEALRYRLYTLLYEEDTLRRSGMVRKDPALLCPLTLETIFLFAMYFGWEFYFLRYSDYTDDPISLKLSRKVVGSIGALDDFPDEAFSFSPSEQYSLGSVIVRPSFPVPATGTFEMEFPAPSAIDIYRFEEVLIAGRENNAPIARSPGILAAIDALEEFGRGEPLRGRQRLEAILSALVELLEYLEKAERFSVEVERRSLVRSGCSERVEVVHRTSGRLRVRVPGIKADEGYAGRLRERLLSLAFVKDASVNPPTGSLTVYYDTLPSPGDPAGFLIDFLERETAGRVGTGTERH
jgi:hypothetical protein